MVIAGALVGLGTRMANGCTSGHGVCGISRLAPRGIASTVLYLFAGAVTVFLFGPFEMLGNGLIAFVIFVVAGTAAGYAYAKLAKRG